MNHIVWIITEKAPTVRFASSEIRGGSLLLWKWTREMHMWPAADMCHSIYTIYPYKSITVNLLTMLFLLTIFAENTRDKEREGERKRDRSERKEAWTRQQVHTNRTANNALLLCAIYYSYSQGKISLHNEKHVFGMRMIRAPVRPDVRLRRVKSSKPMYSYTNFSPDTVKVSFCDWKRQHWLTLTINMSAKMNV